MGIAWRWRYRDGVSTTILPVHAAANDAEGCFLYSPQTLSQSLASSPSPTLPPSSTPPTHTSDPDYTGHTSTHATHQSPNRPTKSLASTDPPKTDL